MLLVDESVAGGMHKWSAVHCFCVCLCVRYFESLRLEVRKPTLIELRTCN